MIKDYSEYQHSDFEKYQIPRQSNSYVYYDLFVNYASFKSNSKSFRIMVDSFHEDISMKESLEEFDEQERTRNKTKTNTVTKTFPDDPEEDNTKDLEKQKALEEYFSTKYKINWDDRDRLFKSLKKDYNSNELLSNVLSGTSIELNIGEGILDFIYADFRTPFIESYKFASVLEEFFQTDRRKSDNERIKKIYNSNQEDVELYFKYIDSSVYFESTAKASLYSAICPPVFIKEAFPIKGMDWYLRYLISLQKEYLELIEFCFDENFYPEVMNKNSAVERYWLYRNINDQPYTIVRDELFRFSILNPKGNPLPLHIPDEDIITRMKNPYTPTQQHKDFQSKYKLSDVQMEVFCRFPIIPNTSYKFKNIREALELELTKVFEQDIRFRKCKRCGKYFIMKGNYDTSYCDRVAENETRNCQQIMATEKYKQKTAGNAAIKIYNKYYKRYSARVKAHTILEKDFKKWKYEAMTKRDECTKGNLSEEEYTEWMEKCFPNRKRKH